MSGFRLPTGGGGIDRSAPLSFTFDGKACSGFSGDSIASALLASGIAVVARSFKYHRPRGIWGAGCEEPNAIVDARIDGYVTPNLRATTEALRDGMELRAVNARPTAESDAYGWLDRLARFLPAGFYYKTFMRPSWQTWEPGIRALAGLGRLDPQHCPPADCALIHASCDVLIVGAGPAGLAAAQAAARGGRTVFLLDDQSELGGSLLHRGGEVNGAAWREWAAEVRSAVTATGGRVLMRTTAFGIYDHRLVLAWERRSGDPDVLWHIRPARIVLAAGAIERPLIFPDNDRPGIMSADAALVYLRRFAVMPGRRIVIATNNDSAYPVAEAFAEAGAQVDVLDARDDPPAPKPQAFKVTRGIVPTGVRGSPAVSAVEAKDRLIGADALLVSGGWSPTVHLFCQAGGKLRYDDARACFAPRAMTERLAVAGAANGGFTLAVALAQGHLAGGGAGPPPRAPEGSYAIRPMAPAVLPGARQWIDFQNDVTLDDVALARREGFVAVEHLKRYTTLGMASDQGKTSNVNGIAAMAALTLRPMDDVGTTTYRPPFIPIPFTVIAGRRRGQLFNPLKRLALENEHRAAGAVFREYGGWLRPAWYGEGEASSLIAREAQSARQSVALFDASPLGKIEVLGPDAAALLDFNSFTRLSTLKSGQARYGFMLTEGGVVYDDGVTLRFGDDRFLLSCSSAHVEGVRLRLDMLRQDRFDTRRVFVHDATAGWATVTVTGPRALDLLEAAALDIDLDDACLPHMAFAEGRFGDAPLRIARVSFTGDRSYEVSVPLSAAAPLYRRLSDRLTSFGGGPLGLEALMILRAEKGYVLVGKDTDGTTMPQDLGLASPRDDEFIGKRSLLTPEASRPDRRQFVGLTVAASEMPLPAGAHALAKNGAAGRSIGFVTSSYASPNLGRPIALGLIENGLRRIGDEIDLYHLGSTRRALISPAVAFDPERTRLHA